MDKTQENGVPAGIGLVTVFTVLLVLVLAVFSALTLFTAQADERLSRANAAAVTAYYAADAQACMAQEAFAAGTQAEYEADFPMTEVQSLHIRLGRTPEGGVERLEWRTVTNSSTVEEAPLPVWDGAGLPGQ